ncbi:hypothetical protein A4R35_18030 [Thermogemmatispora tikiterensis]|uniref:Uncharacterized protein n=1 Tax=Thermogemmatispora tikiterensis TaxID=1825093 RepID=A0A328VMH5_9CHLR|nr:hypothetical protein A4R35_18030 [Thermogemmatispora tikiterensis]
MRGDSARRPSLLIRGQTRMLLSWHQTTQLRSANSAVRLEIRLKTRENHLFTSLLELQIQSLKDQACQAQVEAYALKSQSNLRFA